MSKLIVFVNIAAVMAIVVCNNINVYCVSTDVETSEAITSELPITGHYEIEENILRKLNKIQFLAKIRPNQTTNVKVNIFVRDIQMKNSNKLNFDIFKPWTVDLVLRQYWNDPRLAYNLTGPIAEQYRYFPLNSPKSIWKPDLFFPESSAGDFHFVTTPNSFLWLYPNGDLVYSLRLSLNMSCRQSSVHRFGHGIGTPIACPLRIASYAFTTDQLSLEWVDQDPVEVREKLYEQLDNNFCTLDKVTANATTTSTTRTGTYTVLPTEFEFLC